MKKYGSVRLGKAFFLMTILFATTFTACQEKEEDRVKPKTITDVLLENDQFSILREIVQYAGMSDALRTTEMTIFAPNNGAFGKAGIFSAAPITGLPKDSVILFLSNHIVGSQVLKYSNLTAGTLKPLKGATLRVSKIDSTVSINASDIIIRDVNADNGAIQVIDSVLVNFRK